MARNRIILGAALLIVLSACTEDDSTEEFVGRWAHEKSKIILQIDDIDGDNVKVSQTMLFMNRYITNDTTGRLDDGGALVSEMGRFVHQAQSDHLITDGGTFVRAPDGWMPDDGRDKLAK